MAQRGIVLGSDWTLQRTKVGLIEWREKMPIGRLLPIAALFGLSLGLIYGQVGAAFSQDSAAAVAAAQKAATDALSSPSEWKGPTTGPKPIAGKRLAIIPCGLITEGC